jgi:hypothetical protein
MYRRAPSLIAVLVLVSLAGCGGATKDEDVGTPSGGSGGSMFAVGSGGMGSGGTGSTSAAVNRAGSGGTTSVAHGTGGSGGAPAVAGTGGATQPDLDASTSPPDAGIDAGSVPAGPPTGTFPPITDPWQAGAFSVATMPAAGPSGNATVLYPMELGKDGLKHPIVVWDNGAGQTGLSIYGALLEHLASHGFAVYAAYSATDEGTELTQGLDWMIAQNDVSSSPFYQKLDPQKTAAMGHSQGSIATFAVAGDARLTTTIHLSGGTNPDIAEGHATLPNLHNPAAFLCGEPGGDGLIVGDTASEWCAYDFEHATVPVFLAQITGASHISAPGMTLGACAAWLRWRLMADTTQKSMFVGSDCGLCTRPNWVVKERGLD